MTHTPKLQELRKNWPTAKYEPLPDCKVCGGRGEKTNSHGIFGPCMCIFVSHDMLGLAQETMAATVRKLKREIGPADTNEEPKS